MPNVQIARLHSRAAVAVTGPDWRPFLQGLISQDVLDLEQDAVRFGALLSPQGRLAFDLFIVGREDGCLLDCASARRDALVGRLSLYRLRARVEVAACEIPIEALWGDTESPPVWKRDPRLAAMGWRGYGATTPASATRVDEAAYESLRLKHGIPGAADLGVEDTYPLEADFDLLNGVDFDKGCFVGQETTSRMKRRGAIRSRMAPLLFEGLPPPRGSEVLAGERRAGETLGGMEGRGMALLRLDRLGSGPLTLADGRACRVEFPAWWGSADPSSRPDPRP